MAVVSLWFSIVIAVLALALYFVKDVDFQVQPHERELDNNSFIIAKLSKALLAGGVAPSFEAAAKEVPKGRLLFHSFLRVFEFVDFLRDQSLMEIPVAEVNISVLANYNEGNKGMSQIRARVYNFKQNAQPNERKPVMVWYHGGGWTKGSMEHDHSMCLKFAKELDFIIVNVDYRMAPEHVFPTAIEDAYEGFQWVLGNIYDYGGDDSQIVLGGESAGGNLAAAVMAKYLGELAKEGARISAQPVVGMYLVYPALDYYSDPTDPTNILYGNTNGILTLDGTENARILYAGTTDMEVRKNFLYAPLLTPIELLRQFPPTIFVLAKFDVLTEESLRLHRMLNQLSIPTRVFTYGKTVHGFFGREIISPAGPIALRETAAELKRLVSAMYARDHQSS